MKQLLPALPVILAFLLDSLIGEVNTHIVARDGVKILDDTSGEFVDSMSVIVG